MFKVPILFLECSNFHNFQIEFDESHQINEFEMKPNQHRILLEHFIKFKEISLLIDFEIIYVFGIVNAKTSKNKVASMILFSLIYIK